MRKVLRINKRRRRQNKTNYKKRMVLLKSNMPRIVIRRSNKYFTVQVVVSVHAQDTVVASVSSRDLLKNGWDKKNSGSLKSLSAGYKAGLLLAKKVVEDKNLANQTFILDFGITTSKKGSRFYAVTKGLCDGGVTVRVDKEMFPKEERIAVPNGKTKPVKPVKEE